MFLFQAAQVHHVANYHRIARESGTSPHTKDGVSSSDHEPVTPVKELPPSCLEYKYDQTYLITILPHWSFIKWLGVHAQMHQLSLVLPKIFTNCSNIFILRAQPR